VPYVLTIDQRGSRRSTDRVPAVLTALSGVPTVLRFERTAGDEVQGVLDDPAGVVEVVRRLSRDGGWSIGVGAGAVQTPLPRSTRAGAGPAFVAARAAVEAAKRRPVRIAVRGAAAEPAADAQAVLTALAALVERRSEPAWEAVELVESGRTQAEAAAELGVTRQAVGQRLAAGLWEVERDLGPAAVRLLVQAAG